MVSILFVCLGNICRSPIAEGTMKSLITKKELSHKIEVDSAGTMDYHIGDLPDRRTRKNAQSHGLVLEHACRQLNETDFRKFDYIVAMDQNNWDDINKLALMSFGQYQPEENCFLLRKFDPITQDNLSVPDPYYGTEADFEEVFQIVNRCNEALLEHIIKKENL